MPRLLLDTHVALWWLTAHPRQDGEGQALISGSECHLSAASIWEVAIMFRLGIGPHALLEATREARIRLLPVMPEHSATSADLPRLHRDPFDRLLIAQARQEQLRLDTADRRVGQYGGDIQLL